MKKRAPWCRRTVGGDKGYDVRESVDVTRALRTTIRVTQNLARPVAARLMRARPGIQPTQ
jgi:hypothetical protein